MGTITLKSGRDESLKRRHPWLFSGAVRSVDSSVRSGETVDILSSGGDWLASGAYSEHSQIRVRVWSFDHDEDISGDFFRRRLERAVRARDPLLGDGSVTACRLVFGESDGLPGLIVDRYGDFLVCQFLAAGVEYHKNDIIGQLKELAPAEGIYERSDADVRLKEGLELRTGVLEGKEPPELIEIREEELRYLIDIRHGHKTGFYLDQRENRACIGEFSGGAEALNCFSYTGGFGLCALKGGAAAVTNIDTSPDAAALARLNVSLNGLDESRVEYITGDVFKFLRTFRDSRRQFDLIVLDPPKFVGSAAQLAGGSRGYKDINLLAFKLLRPGGVLFTFSCSGLLDPALFQKIVFDAALDAGRDACIIRYLGQASDHPVALNFPESRYLKGFICTVW